MIQTGHYGSPVAPLLHGLMEGKSCQCSLPGDSGFDPFALRSEPESLRWNQQAELVLIGWSLSEEDGQISSNWVCKHQSHLPDFPNKKLTGKDVGYISGLWFDPLGWGSGSPGPIDNLFTHLADPGYATIFAPQVMEQSKSFSQNCSRNTSRHHHGREGLQSVIQLLYH
ncbi:photosystem I light harvesting complex 2 [Abeliophyllum distichum]|uniref:Photosystem I light harvesting complex 2 n=1 Tax=Abeliophyllum distichum TaxID=126358 RepID=A0ABD1W1F7_9LAMI